MFDIWNQRITVAEEAYHLDNYKIEYNHAVDNNECVLYFSSNNIWFPNTEEEFCKSIFENDRYEWEKKPYRVGRKNIYLRDIYKSWYIQGINEEISSVDAIVDWLRKETSGYEVVCIGSSAGGYMAALVGIMLKAKLIYAFSAQFCLYNEGYYDVNPFLQKYKSDADKEKYYDITDLVNKSDIPIVYIYPNRCRDDELQAERIIPSESVLKYGLNSSHHGVVVNKCNLLNLLNMGLEQLRALVECDCKSVLKLSIRLSGVLPTFQYYFKTAVKVFKRKVRQR